MKKLKVIACDVLKREVCFLLSRSPCYIDVTFLPQGLHQTPDKLRAFLREEIEKAEEGLPRLRFDERIPYDFIVLAYGLCDNSVAGLQSSRVPLVIPRAHDCITLLLGSKERYSELFSASPGTYWYSRGWIERSLQPGEDRYKRARERYAQKYGEENADYLMEMEQGWFKNYERAFFIDWKELGNTDFYRDYTKTCASYLKWNYEETEGSMALLEKILSGVFDEEETLVVPPGMACAASFDDGIISAVPPGGP